ncbi:MAG: Flp pilus assembly protein CpaB [Kiritimatiellae bacterium]|nr:Flp pilus assembly protein CpaB [Kiritimatiellia bacterium]
MKRKIVLLLSLVAGLIAAVLTRLYLSGVDSQLRAQRQAMIERYGEMDVLCYIRDLPSGSELSKADIGVKRVPAIGMRGQALTTENVADIVGRKTLIAHRQGEVMFWADIEGGDPSVKGLSADIKKEMRAISINCAGASSVSGMVKPNDHVDVIGTFNFPGTEGDPRKGELVTCTILQNVLVLATGGSTSKNQSGSASYSTVTLEVTPREAEMLVFAEQIRGRLTLTLRNRSDIYAERELPNVDFNKIRSEIETLNNERQLKKLSNRR